MKSTMDITMPRIIPYLNDILFIFGGWFFTSVELTDYIDTSVKSVVYKRKRTLIRTLFSRA